ncbi:hypothetical protein E1I18_01760 [Mycoplasmopsis mucosicanis]|uniref:Lipoprotein n=1 Tax=Mycoplasmopsis mucosicanis TaxID=458208 RepID=A0A507SQG2_9BACT|nr:hypothetical protein [Mycoplasmopsis mucosicanis]TQC51612.1 hypothetical protein E1I18_01760 [Mycoplasmopsis mucosicanis]
MKYTKLILSTGALAGVPLVAVACSNVEVDPNRKVLYNVNPSQFGINLSSNVKTRTLLFAAATGENFLHDDGVFRFGLHHSPLRGVSGDWTAIAARVKSATDNTLVEPNEFKIAKASVKKVSSVEFGRPLSFEWTGDQKLSNNAFYTFIFYKNDGTERIVFSGRNIQSNRDIFPSKNPNVKDDSTQATPSKKVLINEDATQFEIKLSSDVKTRTLLFAAATSENFLHDDGVFRFGLHHSPLRGATGEWVAVAARVKSANDNSLVEPKEFKIAQATVKNVSNIDAEKPLEFAWEGEQKLSNNAFYTFIFYKKDGTERIVFSQANIDGNRDIFPSRNSKLS